MNNDVKKPDASGLTARFTPAAFPTELRVSEMIDFQGDSDMDRLIETIQAGRHLAHTPI